MQTQLSAMNSPNSNHSDVVPHSVVRIHASEVTPSKFYEKYQIPGIPVVISGLFELDWNLDFLSQKLGDLQLPVRYYGRERYTQDKRTWTSMGSGVDARTLTFSTYVEMLKSGEAYEQDVYLARCSLKNTPLAEVPELEQAEQHLGLRSPATHLNLWVGPGEHTSCLHYDPMDGTLMQLYGAKKVTLFPPSQLYNLYPFSVLNHLKHGLKIRSVYSQVYPERPDLDSFPKFREAMKYQYEVILQPGDTLFLPAGWWHEVTALENDVVCSVNRFWHVHPLSRALGLWSKWRAHVASVLAVPHIVWNVMLSLRSMNPQQELRKLIQQL